MSTEPMPQSELVEGVRRLGLFGGTFDPPHVGHVAIAAEAVHSLGLERLIVTVAGDPYLKRPAVEADAIDRLALAEAAFSGLASVEVDDREVRRSGPTYTIDTVDELRGADPSVEVYLIVGADVAATVAKWHRADDLARLVTLAVVARAGDSPKSVGGFRCVKFEVVRVDVSSSQIRRRVARAEPIDGIVPPAVIHEIRERRLYTGGR